MLLWKADELDDLTSYFPAIFSKIYFISASHCSSSASRRYSKVIFDSAAWRFDVLPPKGSESHWGLLQPRPLSPSHQCTCAAQAVLSRRLRRNPPLSRYNPAQVHVLLSETERLPTLFPSSLQNLRARELMFPFPFLRTFSAVMDEWGLAAKSATCYMAAGMP